MPWVEQNIHIINEGNGWIATHGTIAEIFKEFLFLELLPIVTVPVGKEDELDSILRVYDGKLNHYEVITCRVWLWMVLRRLQYKPENTVQTLKCSKLEKLTKEAVKLENFHPRGIAMNEQRRPLGSCVWTVGNLEV